MCRHLAVTSENLTSKTEQPDSNVVEIGCSFLLFTNTKLHTGCRLVPNLLTWNGVMVIILC